MFAFLRHHVELHNAADKRRDDSEHRNLWKVTLPDTFSDAGQLDSYARAYAVAVTLEG